MVYVDNRLRAGIFGQDDLDLLASIAASAAIAIDNARLYVLAVEKGRLERELQVAREVQASLLPQEMPHLAGWEFAVYWQPARVVGGDFYDFIPDLAANDRRQLGLAIADVSDKGMPAALFMAATRSTVRASMAGKLTDGAAEGIARANRLICADASNGMFVTLFYAGFRADSNRVVYVNAGHNPPLLVRQRAPASQAIASLGRTALLLGFAEDAEVQEDQVDLAPGDFLVLYTDGLTESVDAGEQEFGEERLRALLLELRKNRPPAMGFAAQVVRALAGTLASFTGDAPPFDDITVVVACRSATPAD